MKDTKIVSTLGPATDSKDEIEELVEAGVNVFRQNFSHVSHKEHKQVFERVRQVSEKVPVMADTKGPEIRLGEIEEGTTLEEGDCVEITVEEVKGDAERFSVNYGGFLENIEPGDEVRIDDGKIELEVVKVEDAACCEVVYGGSLSSKKAVNIPGKEIGLSAPTEKDKEDIRFAAREGYDFISLSFVKEASDVKEVRKILDEEDSDAHIISKIEHVKAVENFDEILEVTDAVMVARGDLGVEMPASKLPMMQKEMIQKCNKAGKPVITATQMLESMTENSTATRAEISDVANAVLDGTDAVMLSGETAIGEYPVKTVEFMSEIVEEVESTMEENVHHTVKEKPGNTREIICKNVWQASRDSNAEYIIAHTSSGSTARHISKYRPEKPVIAFADSEKTERQLNLVWGVQPYYQEFPENVEKMLEKSAKRMQNLDLAQEDTKLVMSAGIPTKTTGTTNMLQIRKVKELLN
jgi:pyruvate kinase